MNEPKSLFVATLTAAALALIAGPVPITADETSGLEVTREATSRAAIEGKVVEPSGPISEATVYAYEVATYSLEKVRTDGRGRFLFGKLPAGMYKVIAYKSGFAPTVALLLRRRAEDNQYIEIEMHEESADDIRQAETYWQARGRVPPDVLRDIRTLWARDQRSVEPGAQIAGLRGFEGNMLAQSGNIQLGNAYGEAQWTGAEFGLQGAVGAMQLGFNGLYQQLTPNESGTPDAQVRSFAVALENPGTSKLQVASSAGQLANNGNGSMKPVDLAHYRVQWSGRTGQRGQSDVTAQYTEEANYHQAGWVNPANIPGASRTWHLKGAYSGELTEHTSLKAGVSYRQRDGATAYLAHLTGFQPEDALSNETIGVYGLAGSQILPRVVVEYGLYSSVSDGGLSLMPHGGMVVDIGSDWKARTSFARRVESNEPDLGYRGFSTAFYNDDTACRDVGEACYEVVFSRGEKDDSISVGAVHREFAETLRLYFSPDFFDRLESLFVVQGDQLPELQFSMVRRIAPKVLAKLESNIASGGGGIFYATDDKPYENQIRYLVTSLDTRFQQTSTGVFVAFHHVEQQLNPVAEQLTRAQNEVEIQRLQLMLTQDLNVLADFASNWAVRFNVELSRGATPYQLSTDEELHKKLSGGISVSF